MSLEDEKRNRSRSIFKPAFLEIASQLDESALKGNLAYAACPLMLSDQQYVLEVFVGHTAIDPIVRLVMRDISRRWSKFRTPLHNIILREDEIIRLQLEFTQYERNVCISPYGITRREFEGKGFMTGIALNSACVIGSVIDRNLDYFSGRGIFIEIEDVAKSQQTGRKNGFSSRLAQSMGFTYFEGDKRWRSEYTPAE